MKAKWADGNYSVSCLMLGKAQLATVSWGAIRGEQYVAKTMMGHRKSGFSEASQAKEWAEQMVLAFAKAIINGLGQQA